MSLSLLAFQGEHTLRLVLEMTSRMGMGDSMFVLVGLCLSHTSIGDKSSTILLRSYFLGHLSPSTVHMILFSKMSAPIDTLHHHFIAYYNHFEGDVKVCLCLYNSYLAQRIAILESTAAKIYKKTKKPMVLSSHRRRPLLILKKLTNYSRRALCQIIVNWHKSETLE